MADKKNRKSKCIFFSFFKENLENALKQGKNGIEVVKVVTFIRGCSEFNNFIHTQLSDTGCFTRVVTKEIKISWLLEQLE